ncbi:unnamed protein product [Rotaria socialis]|uniref:Methyltransferase FkbM domain-containing protein n=1 Tax=Rotaria socialis TaxID=392032 RepID=A0A817R9C7_9BILA|nr:unnamed protein product [Rotaria socialis]
MSATKFIAQTLLFLIKKIDWFRSWQYGLTGVYVFKNSFLFSFINSYSSKIFISWKTSFNDHVDLNILTSESFKCVKTKLLLDKYRTTVCVHEIQKDRDVSGHLVSHGIWEEHLVTRFIRILSTYKQYSFIDIGANLGKYTIYAASLGCSNIISIECFRPNIERIRR